MYKGFIASSILPRLWRRAFVFFIVGRAAHSAARHERLCWSPACRDYFPPFVLCLVENSRDGERLLSGLRQGARPGTGVVAPAPQGVAPADPPDGQQKALDGADGSGWPGCRSCCRWARNGICGCPAPGSIPLIQSDQLAQPLLCGLPQAGALHFRCSGLVDRSRGLCARARALSGRPAWANSRATTPLSCQLFTRGVELRATNTRSYPPML